MLPPPPQADQAPPRAAVAADEDKEGDMQVIQPPGLTAVPPVVFILMKYAVQGGRNVKGCEYKYCI